MRMSFRAIATIVAMAVFFVAPASGQSMKSMQLASDLGSVLAAEEACGLSYDQSAIGSFIEENVDADDMSFPSTLQMMTAGSKFELEDMSTSSLTAHCVQIRRVAKSFSFIE
jgi:hypothetical protein